MQRNASWSLGEVGVGRGIGDLKRGWLLVAPYLFLPEGSRFTR